MQVLVKSTDERAETHCTVCGRGFVMFWERHAEADRVQMLKDVDVALKNHHCSGNNPAAHPDHGFLVPDWDGPVAASGAAILGNAPTWAL
jgi:hypothetical protein